MTDWEEIKSGLSILLFMVLICILAPSSIVFGLYLTNKVFFPQFAPTCEVKK